MPEIAKIKSGEMVNLNSKDFWIYRESLYFPTLRDEKFAANLRI
ncbi:MAG: hypothetical protein ACR2N3_13890 [Pyrinomonadaceae bacterium]